MAYTIDDIRTKVKPIAEDYGINKLALFGSYARGEATDESDMDFLILDLGELKGYVMLSGFKMKLEEALKVPVDVLTTRSVLDDEMLDLIRKDEILLYG
jgi:predicted nucleotidyltransferase